MKRLFLLFFAVIFFGACKSKAVIAEAAAGKVLTSEKIIAGHYSNKKDFQTLYIKATTRYKDANQTQNVTAEIKIKKDEKILVSIRFLGITMAKALITPTEVKYYEKINGEYFEGDYTTLSRWLGTDLDYIKVQNLFIGQAIDDLQKETYTTSIAEGLYRLENKSASINKKYYFEGERFLVKKEEISQPAKQRTLNVSYPNYKEYSQATLPVSVLIQAIQPKGKTDITIDYTSVTFNEEFSFPYSVPDGYERIFID